MTSTGDDLPVNFWTAESWSIMKTLCFCVHQQESTIYTIQAMTYLFVSNSELALRLLVVVGKVLELLNRIVRGDSDAKLDVGLGVLVTRL